MLVLLVFLSNSLFLFAFYLISFVYIDNVLPPVIAQV